MEPSVVGKGYTSGAELLCFGMGCGGAGGNVNVCDVRRGVGPGP